MPTVKLTDAAVQRFKADPGKRLEYFDATLPGFGLRVAGPTPRTPEGRKSWVLFYRYRGEQKRMTLALPYPALGLGDARKQAGDALQLVAKGVDPATQRAEDKAEAQRKRDTIASTVEMFLTSGMKGKKGKPLAKRYLDETRRNFDNHVLPRWRHRDLVSITRRDLVALLDAIAACEVPEGHKPKTKQLRQPGGPVAANRVLAAVRAMFNWALRRGMVEVNPCALIEQPGEETRRERTLTAAEIRELWPLFGAAGYPFGAFFQMALLTGQRRGEVAGMRWADLDTDAKTWTLEAGSTKGGRSHVVPLSQPALDILSAAPRKAVTEGGRTKPSPFVFTSDGSAPISGFSRAKVSIDEKAAKARIEAQIDPMDRWGIHDLRRTAATEMGRLGTPEFVIGKVLNHSSRGVTGQVYNRYEYLAEKRHALEQWGAYLERLVFGETGNVVVLRA